MNVKCKIIKKVYANEDYRIFSCRPVGISDVKVNKYGTFSIIGNLSYLVEGQICNLNLVNEQESKYGFSYNVDACPSLVLKDITPDVTMGIMCEITSKTQSKYVLSAYPNFVQMVLDGKENEIDVKKIYNVKEYRLAVYCREIREKFKFLKIIQENKQYELTNSECKELVQKFETIDEVNKQLKENPYVCLVQYLQRNFEQIDPIILGYNNTLRLSFQRTESLICYILQLNEKDGSTVISANDMAKYCIDITPELTSQIVQVTKDSQVIYYNEETKQTALMSTYLQECEVAQFVREKLENPVNLNIDYKKHQHSQEYDMTDEQIEILRIASEQNIGLLLGSAGSGKTFSIKSLISMLDDNDLTYTLVTPTGTSAKVLSKYTNRYASTIHKKILSDGEITTDFLIIDEFSFVSLDVMIMIVRAISNHTKIIMSADEYQLPSISKGNILKDMIDSKIIPIARLTKVFRYGIGALSTVATDTRNGQRYIDANNSPIFTNPNNDKSYEFIPVSENPLEQVIKAYDTLLQTYSTDDILILSPQNIGSVGSYAISNAIQEKYNPLHNRQEEVSYARQKNKIKFRKGDKVLNTVNWYNALTLAEYNGEGNTKKVDVMNGNFGKVLDIEDGNIIAQFDNDFVVYTKKEINRLLLGYACSVNKAQGNQSLAVISINHPQHKYLNRALVYVANSRAREKLIEIGEARTIADALSVVIANERKTMLKNLLIERINNASIS